MKKKNSRLPSCLQVWVVTNSTWRGKELDEKMLQQTLSVPLSSHIYNFRQGWPTHDTCMKGNALNELMWYITSQQFLLIFLLLITLHFVVVMYLLLRNICSVLFFLNSLSHPNTKVNEQEKKQKTVVSINSMNNWQN